MPFLITGTSFPPKIPHYCLLRDFCMPEQRDGPTSQVCIVVCHRAGLIKVSLRHLECFSPSLGVPLLLILCLLKPHPPLNKTFPLVLFQFAVWSKCWANTLLYAAFLFENDFIEYN